MLLEEDGPAACSGISFYFILCIAGRARHRSRMQRPVSYVLQLLLALSILHFIAYLKLYFIVATLCLCEQIAISWFSSSIINKSLVYLQLILLDYFSSMYKLFEDKVLIRDSACHDLCIHSFIYFLIFRRVGILPRPGTLPPNRVPGFQSEDGMGCWRQRQVGGVPHVRALHEPRRQLAVARRLHPPHRQQRCRQRQGHDSFLNYLCSIIIRL